MVNMASAVDVTFVDNSNPFSRNKKLRIGNYPTAFELDNHFASHVVCVCLNIAKIQDLARFGGFSVQPPNCPPLLLISLKIW
jgi:hypothetical protein